MHSNVRSLEPISTKMAWLGRTNDKLISVYTLTEWLGVLAKSQLSCESTNDPLPMHCTQYAAVSGYIQTHLSSIPAADQSNENVNILTLFRTPAPCSAAQKQFQNICISKKRCCNHLEISVYFTKFSSLAKSHSIFIFMKKLLYFIKVWRFWVFCVP